MQKIVLHVDDDERGPSKINLHCSLLARNRGEALPASWAHEAYFLRKARRR
jgi:hypothetical protein